MIEIDGSYGEGGGSIVRLAVAFSAITRKAIKIKNIRSKRCQAGLREQHLQAINAVCKFCGGRLKNAFVGSTAIEFFPNNNFSNKIDARIGTSGSIGLFLQCVLLPCFFSGKDVEIDISGGGTLGLWSPNIYYTKNIFLPMISKMGFEAELEILKHGFYPKGGAKVKVLVKYTKKKKPICINDRGKFKKIEGISVSSLSLKNANVAERMSEAARKILERNFSKIEIKEEYHDTLSPGCGIILWAEFENTIIGWDALGERGKPSEQVGKEAAEGLLEQLNSECTVDEYLTDQLVPYMALVPNSCIKFKTLTKHAETNIWLSKKFLPTKFEITNNLLISK